MSTMTRRLTVPLALVVALAVTPALAACAGNPIENLIEGATGGQVDLGGTTIPADFPAEVPLFSGDIVNVTGLGKDAEKIWNVSIVVPDGLAFDTIASQLQAAGFEGGSIVAATADGGTGVFTGANYGVFLVVTKDGNGGFVANYTITTTSK